MSAAISVNLAALAACLKVAPKNAKESEGREYLQGVYFDRDRLTATDGKVLVTIGEAVARDDDSAQVPEYPPFILPYDAALEICRAAKPCRVEAVTLALGDASLECPLGYRTLAYTLDRSVQFPDYRYIVPRSVSLEPAQFNPAILARVQDALDIYRKSELLPLLHTDGPNKGALITRPDCENFLAVVMPYRVKEVAESVPSALAKFHGEPRT